MLSRDWNPLIGELGFLNCLQREKGRGKETRKVKEKEGNQTEPRGGRAEGPRRRPRGLPGGDHAVSLAGGARGRPQRSPKPSSPLPPPRRATDLRRQRAGPTSETRSLDPRAASARPSKPVAAGCAPRQTARRTGWREGRGRRGSPGRRGAGARSEGPGSAAETRGPRGPGHGPGSLRGEPRRARAGLRGGRGLFVSARGACAWATGEAPASWATRAHISSQRVAPTWGWGRGWPRLHPTLRFWQL